MTNTSSFNFDFDPCGANPSKSMPLKVGNTFLDEPLNHVNTAANYLPARDVGDEQYLGWQSPTVPQYTESLHRPAEEMVWPAGSLADDAAKPSQPDLVAENAALKARLAQLEAPKTPSPRKRTASYAFVGNTTPPKPPQPISLGQGPIQSMWSPGVSPEERDFIGQTHTSSPAANAPPAKKRRTAKKDTRPVTNTDATPKERPANRQTKHKTQRKRSKTSPACETFDIDGDQVTLSAEALREPIRPVAKLLNMPWDNLTHIEKATLLLPMLQGVHPATGEQLDAPGSLALEEQTPDAQTAHFLEPGDNINDGHYIGDVSEFNHQPFAQDFTGIAVSEENNYDEDATEDEQSLSQHFTNIADLERRRYIQDVAEPAFLSHACILNNDAVAEEQVDYTEDTVARALFSFDEDSNNASISKRNNFIDANLAQDSSSFHQSFDFGAWTQGIPSDETTPEYINLTDNSLDQADDINACMVAAFETESQASSDLFTGFPVADQSVVNRFDQISDDVNDPASSETDFDYAQFTAPAGDFENLDGNKVVSEIESYGIERQRQALERFSQTGGRRR